MTVYGVGFDSGKYNFNKCENGKHTKFYSLWKDMMRRCYSSNKQNKSYDNVTVSNVWHDFQEFALWCKDNYVSGYQLDKDILGDGSYYSPDVCVFIPKPLNMFTTNMKGKKYCGVSYNRKANSYVAYCNNGNGKTINLGYRSTPEEAFILYKEYKESLSKKLAIEYYNNNLINQRVYNALYNLEVK